VAGKVATGGEARQWRVSQHDRGALRVAAGCKVRPPPRIFRWDGRATWALGELSGIPAAMNAAKSRPSVWLQSLQCCGEEILVPRRFAIGRITRVAEGGSSMSSRRPSRDFSVRELVVTEFLASYAKETTGRPPFFWSCRTLKSGPRVAWRSPTMKPEGLVDALDRRPSFRRRGRWESAGGLDEHPFCIVPGARQLGRCSLTATPRAALSF
jgi:hypothetical protein